MNEIFQKVKGPANGILIASILSIVVNVVLIILMIAGVGADLMKNENGAAFKDAFDGISGVISIIFLTVLSIVTLIGSLKMKKLENYTYSFASAILTLIPCMTSFCCLLNIPIGIWALITLTKNEVKSAFKS